MLTIENFRNIEGKEFQLSNGTKYIIGIARGYHDHYSFGVFELDDRNVANIHNSIIFKLQKELCDYGVYKAYSMTSAQMKQIVKVTPENLTLKNFVLELHIQTGMIVNRR